MPMATFLQLMPPFCGGGKLLSVLAAAHLGAPAIASTSIIFAADDATASMPHHRAHSFAEWLGGNLGFENNTYMILFHLIGPATAAVKTLEQPCWSSQPWPSAFVLVRASLTC
jgi:hypothetical protein